MGAGSECKLGVQARGAEGHGLGALRGAGSGCRLESADGCGLGGAVGVLWGCCWGATGVRWRCGLAVQARGCCGGAVGVLWRCGRAFWLQRLALALARLLVERVQLGGHGAGERHVRHAREEGAHRVQVRRVVTACGGAGNPKP